MTLNDKLAQSFTVYLTSLPSYVTYDGNNTINVLFSNNTIEIYLGYQFTLI